MNKKNRKFKWENIIIILIVTALIVTLIISIFNIVKWKMNSNKTNEEITNIQEEINVEEVEDTENTEIIEPVEEQSKENPYWDYINMNMINVDFKDLKKTNPDVVGWVKVNGTNINYPFVQANDNKYYLTHSFNKSYNAAGWVFLDYRNNNTNNKNTIIYAHGRTDKTMFGTLRKVLNNGWLNNTNNFVIKISTELENSLWQIFSVYHIPTTSDYLKTDFNDDNEFQDFISMIISRSSHNFNAGSNCYNNSDKMVFHDKLIKKERK